ncbi:MAG: hypothetical protein KF821_08650 [Anaerolineales bacterium]|nr:hypothetical protein [Anaerolineales bacterium]
MPIETTNYLILGAVITFGAIALHLLSFPLRARNLQADLDALQVAPAAKKPAAKKAAPKKAAKKTAAKKTAKKAVKKAARKRTSR